VAEWIGAAEAARRLGVKQATLYSYVSRGVLTRRRGTGGRISLFDQAEVTELAQRGRPRRPAGLAGLVIESGLTEIDDDQLRFRGIDALDLARDADFEDVCALLWAGALPGSGETGAAGSGWQATASAVAAGTMAQAALPRDTFPLERLQVIVPALAAADPLRLAFDPPAVIAAGQAIIAGMVDCLPAATRPHGAGRRGAGQWELDARPAARPGGIAGRVWPKLCAGPPPAGLLDALRAALVLLADHELAASTLAVRVAASVRADPYAVVATGLGALGGALHGGASLGAEAMLAAAQDPADAPRVVGELLRRGERVPGFGHFVYRSGDPRATLLLALVKAAVPASPRLAVADAVLAETHRRALPEPNIDFALAVLASCAGMITGAGEVVFAVARTAGWLAHAMEEYASRTPLRPRAVYTGPAPDR
jgi:citrate synthase